MNLTVRDSDEILAKAAARPDHRIVIAPADAHQPVLYQVPHGVRYRNDNLASRAVRMSTHIGRLCYIARVSDVPTGCGHSLRRGFATDLPSIPKISWQAGLRAKFRACLAVPKYCGQQIGYYIRRCSDRKRHKSEKGSLDPTGAVEPCGRLGT